MAFVGMQHVVAAKITAKPDNAMPTYSAGMVIGKAIQAELSITRNSNPLYADDVVAEDDNSITAMSVSIGMDDFSEEAQAYLGLLKEVTGTGADDKTYYETSGSADSAGLGYMRVRRKGGITTYQGVWVLDVLFGIESENSQTKGESIEWQTPTVNGQAAAHMITTIDTDNPIFRMKKNFTTAAACIDWLDEQAGI